MSSSFWFEQLKSRLEVFRGTRSLRWRKPQSGRRIELEQLEDRTLPSVYIVTTTADTNANPTADPSQPVSLRDAISAANAAATGTAGNPDIIQFNIPASDPRHLYYENNVALADIR